MDWCGQGCTGPLSTHAPGKVSICLCLEGTQQERVAKSGRALYGRLVVALPTPFFWFKGLSKSCEVQVEISSFRNAGLAEWAADKIPALCSETQ